MQQLEKIKTENYENNRHTFQLLSEVCKRKLWLFANGINMEQNSELVAEGKFVHEETYPKRSEKYEEVEIDGVKVDYFDAKNNIIHEIKKSDKIEKAHLWQLKYYIYVFEKN